MRLEVSPCTREFHVTPPRTVVLQRTSSQVLRFPLCTTFVTQRDCAALTVLSIRQRPSILCFCAEELALVVVVHSHFHESVWSIQEKLCGRPNYADLQSPILQVAKPLV